jgi:hypothetical protein
MPLLSLNNKLSHKQYMGGSLLLILCAALYLWPVCQVLRRNIDQGLVPLGADLLNHGGFLYKNLLTVVWPGSYMWLALMYQLFGSSWFVSKTVLFFTLIATTILILALSRKLIDSWLVFLPAATFFVVGPPPWNCNYYHWDALFLFLCCTWFLTKLLEKPSFKLALAAGLSGGLSVFCFQSLGPGIVSGITLSCLLIGLQTKSTKTALTNLLLSYSGFAFVYLCFAIYLIHTGTLQDMIDCTIKFIFSHYETVNTVPYGYCRFLEIIMGGLAAPPPESVVNSNSPATRFFFYTFKLLFAGLAWWPMEIIKQIPIVVPLCAIAVAAPPLIKKQKSFIETLLEHKIIAVWLVLGFGFLLAEWHRPEINRLFWGEQLLLIILFYFIEQTYKKIAWSRLSIYVFNSITILSLLTFAAMHLVYFTNTRETISTRRGPVSTVDNLDIVKAVQEVTKPGDKVFVYPYETVINYLTDTKSPADQPLLQHHFNSDEQFKRVLDDLENGKVKYVVWDMSLNNQTMSSLGFPSYEQVSPDKLVIEQYLHKNYDMVKTYGLYRLLKRKESSDKTTQ